MAQFFGAPRLLPDHLRDLFKEKVTHDLGLTDEVRAKGWGDMTSADCGRVGGHIGGKMVRVLIRQAELALSGREPRP